MEREMTSAQFRDCAEYPYNAIATAHADTSYIELAKKQKFFVLAFEYVLDKVVENERDAYILRDYFSEHLTYAMTGKRYGVSQERVRQIISRTLRTLRKPPHTQAILSGLQSIIERNEQAIAESFASGYAKGYTDHAQGRKAAISRLTDCGTVDATKWSILETSLSTRAINAICRGYGTITVEELSKIPAEELAARRNLGRGTFEEITEFLRGFGYDVTEHDKILHSTPFAGSTSQKWYEKGYEDGYNDGIRRKKRA